MPKLSLRSRLAVYARGADGLLYISLATIATAAETIVAAVKTIVAATGEVAVSSTVKAILIN